jgi:2-polyprenyl-3-methyl-5-hydroxy-6-metoxy-1,4-benzoquinol methylase
VTHGHGNGSGADFRSALYARYVSTFKASQGADSFAWWDHKYLPLLRDLARDARILEIGCGSGGLLAYLARRGFSHAQGIDISAEQVALAQARGAHVQQADAFEFLQYHRETFETLIAVDVLEHFSREELLRLARLVHAALRPGGRVLVQTANGAGLFPGQVIYGDLTHLTIFTPESLAQLLVGADFTGLRFFETGPIPLRVRGKLNVGIWRAVTSLASAVRQVETGKRQHIWTENFICLARKPA